MRIIYRGAESILYLDRWEGETAIVKERIKKGYRLPQIDLRLRRSRTKREVRLLTEARKWGVATPSILHVDEDAHRILMEYVRGQRVKELLASADKKTIRKVCMEIGKSIGKMHAHAIVHGDLTTSNMIWFNGRVYFIDFGLGEFSDRLEDKGVDLNLLYEALRSAHFKILELCWSFIIKGYREECKEADQVLRKVEEIEKRARYVKRS